MLNETEQTKAFIAKANEYEFRAALAPNEDAAREERAKMRHYRDMADPSSTARAVRDTENLLRDMAKGRANRAEAEARRRIKLGMACDGQFEPKPAVVVSPYLNPDVKGQQTEKVIRNIRRDMLEYEFAHRHIGEGQKAAGDLFLATHEHAGIGGGQAIDYAAPKVDSCGKGDPVTDSVLAAHQRLRRIAVTIGEDDYRLLVSTICEGRSFKDVAAACRGPFPSKNSKYEAERYIGMRWRDALTKISNMDLAQGRASGIRVHVSERSTHRPDTWESHTPLHFGATG